MKRININFIGADPTIVFVAPGLWKVTTSDTLTSMLCVKNDTPNQNMEDWGGYNFVDAEADTYYFPSGYSVSVKQYTVFAAEYAETPPKGCLRNYRTLQEAADALEAGNDVQGIMLFDNVYSSITLKKSQNRNVTGFFVFNIIFSNIWLIYQYLIQQMY